MKYKTIAAFVLAIFSLTAGEGRSEGRYPDEGFVTVEDEWITIKFRWDEDPHFPERSTFEIGTIINSNIDPAKGWLEPWPSGTDFEVNPDGGFRTNLKCGYRDVLNYAAPATEAALEDMIIGGCGLAGDQADAVRHHFATPLTYAFLRDHLIDEDANFTIGTTCAETLTARPLDSKGHPMLPPDDYWRVQYRVQKGRTGRNYSDSELAPFFWIGVETGADTAKTFCPPTLPADIAAAHPVLATVLVAARLTCLALQTTISNCPYLIGFELPVTQFLEGAGISENLAQQAGFLNIDVWGTKTYKQTIFNRGCAPTKEIPWELWQGCAQVGGALCKNPGTSCSDTDGDGWFKQWDVNGEGRIYQMFGTQALDCNDDLCSVNPNSSNSLCNCTRLDGCSGIGCNVCNANLVGTCPQDSWCDGETCQFCEGPPWPPDDGQCVFPWPPAVDPVHPSPGPAPTCPSGPGLYCGILDLGQDPSSLYRCLNGAWGPPQPCTHGCVQMSPGTNDHCRPSPEPCPDADGDGHTRVACGGDDCDDSNAFIHPGAVETCDNADENCSGAADEGIEQACMSIFPAPCRDGMQRCVAGIWEPCRPTHHEAETCNGVDDDCDESVDEDCGGCEPGTTMPCYDGPQGTQDTGACRGGTATCGADRAWGSCAGQQTPQAEVPCNGIDENCDGDVSQEVCGPAPAHCGDANHYNFREVAENGVAVSYCQFCSGNGTFVGEMYPIDDGDPCTRDECNPVPGVAHDRVPNGQGCPGGRCWCGACEEGLACDDRDCDGYGTGCARGVDCNGNDPNLHDGCFVQPSCVGPDCELITNGGFEEDFDIGWQRQVDAPGSRIDRVVDNPHSGSFCVIVENPQARISASDTQLIQTNLYPEELSRYTFQVWVRADRPRPLTIQLVRNEAPEFPTVGFHYEISHLQLELVPDWKRIQIQFTARGIRNDSRLGVQLAGATGTTWFDDFSLLRCPAEGCPQCDPATTLCLTDAPDPQDAGPSCSDADGDGYGVGCDLGEDCDDANSSIHPGQSETCNGQDDDCDHLTDEGLTRPCQGPCGGQQTCEAGSWSACPEPHIEACNGQDDNCDGIIDEGCGPCTGEVDGTLIAEGPWGDCESFSDGCDEIGTTRKINIVCQGDEEQVTEDEQECRRETEGVACGDQGACQSEVCVQAPACIDDDGDGAFVNCGVDLDCNDSEPAIRPGEVETCDGLDNDCNGVVDDGLVRDCQGACGPGQETCRAGNWQDCDAPAPQQETCNGLDDDCDGSTDDAIVGLGQACTTGAPGECAAGTSECSNGEVRCAPLHSAALESCDGRDNDCDGDADEELGNLVCGTGLCQVTVPRCLAGVEHVCTPGQPQAQETCGNGIDDNCNGVADENPPCLCTEGQQIACGTDIGACQTGTRTCRNGQYGNCEGSVGPQPERCGNSIDDDCDGQTDEDPPCACQEGQQRPCGISTGACEEGRQTCRDGQFGACQGGIGPQPESCGNQVDDDCDGEADEGCSRGEVVVRCTPSAGWTVDWAIWGAGPNWQWHPQDLVDWDDGPTFEFRTALLPAAGLELTFHLSDPDGTPHYAFDFSPRPNGSGAPGVPLCEVDATLDGVPVLLMFTPNDDNPDLECWYTNLAISRAGAPPPSHGTCP